MATKRTVTTKRRGTKANDRPIPFKPTNGIERAAKRAGIKGSNGASKSPEARAIELIQAIARSGQTLSDESLDTLAGLMRCDGAGGPDEPMARAFESKTVRLEAARVRAGMNGAAKPEADAIHAAMQHVASRFGEQLVKACDMLGEELASYTDPEVNGDDYNVRQALRALWELRWELGIGTDGKAADYAIESAVERVTKQSNGAAAEGGAS